MNGKVRKAFLRVCEVRVSAKHMEGGYHGGISN